MLDRMGQQVLLFIVGILVANILSVEDYALVGMLAIFSAIANIIQDSGFSAALIQKKETTAEEFSSVFWFNLGMSILLYGVLMGCSPLIARFFNQPGWWNCRLSFFWHFPSMRSLSYKAPY